MRVLFVMNHPGSVARHFGSVLRLLSERGHETHVAFTRVTTTATREEVARLTDEIAGLEAGKLPSPGSTRWAVLGRLLRASADHFRYLESPFTESKKLQAETERDAPQAARVLARAARLGGPRTIGALRRATQALERCLPPAPNVERYIAEQSPDLFLVTPLVTRGSAQPEWLRGAKRLGIRTAYPVLSWDNLTTKGLITDVPDLMLVWNEILADEAVELHGVPRKRVRVAGAWSWDHWFQWRPERTREDFCREVGLRPDRPIVLYVGSHHWVLRDEVPFVRSWLQALRAHGGVLAETGVLIRPHPQRKDSQWLAAEFEDPQVSVWPRAGEEPVSDDTRRHYFESFHFSDAVFGINTSSQVEAAIARRPVHTLLLDELRSTQEGTVHFHYLQADEFGGHLIVARTLEEHARQLEASLNGESEDLNERFLRRFVRPFGLDEPSTPRIVDALEELAAGPAPAPDKGPALAPLARAAMLPLAILASRSAARRKAAKPRSPLRALRSTVEELAREQRPVLAGPWLDDEVGELLYWIPFLRLAETASFGLRDRLWIVGRRRSAPWYGGLGASFMALEDILGSAGEDDCDLEDALSDRVPRLTGIDEFRRLAPDLVATARPELARQRPTMRIPQRLLEFAPFAVSDLPSELELPAEYVAVGGAVDGETIALLGERVPLVSLETVNADHETAVLGHASGFVGDYGARVFLAVLLGVPTVVLCGRADDGADLRLATAFLDVPPFGRLHVVDAHEPGRAVELLTGDAVAVAAER